MSKVWPGFHVATGAVRRKDLAYMAIVNDKLAEQRKPNSFFMEWAAGTWGKAGDVKWSTVSMAVSRVPKEQMCAVGEHGEVKMYGSKDDHLEQIADGKISPKGRGTMRCVRAIEGRIYAAGMDRQVYRRDGENVWACLDESMRPPKDSEDVVGFESIDGFSAKDIYAVGWQGAIWRYDGKKWKQLDSPTNTILTGVCCAGDGNTYACGRRGLLLRGKGNAWKLVEHEATKQDFWGVAWFGGKLYLSSLRQVFTLEAADELKPVDMEDDPAESAYHLSTADGTLWSIGQGDIMAFDGKAWSRIE